MLLRRWFSKPSRAKRAGVLLFHERVAGAEELHRTLSWALPEIGVRLEHRSSLIVSVKRLLMVFGRAIRPFLCR